MKNAKDFSILLLLLVTGLSGMVLTFFTPKFRTKMNALVPIPKVFVDEHYLVKKDIRVYTSETDFLSFDLQSKEGWPFKKGLLIEFYPLLDSLDRAFLVNDTFWKDTVNYHFCVNKEALSESLQQQTIHKVEVYSNFGGEWKKVKEHRCSL